MLRRTGRKSGAPQAPTKQWTLEAHRMVQCAKPERNTEMKYLIDERNILGLINAGRITAEDLGLREYTGYLPAMGDVPYAHDGLWDTYLALPKEDARVRRVTVIGKPNSWERKCKNNRVVLKVHSHRETRTIFARYADALDLCIDREMRYHRAERRQLDLWLKARAPFNHTAK